MKNQFYVLEMSNFTEEESMEFLNNALHGVKWGEKQGMALSHLTEKGVQDLEKYVFKQDSVD